MVSILDKEGLAAVESRTGTGRQVRVNRAYAINVKRELALARLLELLASEAGIASENGTAVPRDAESRIARVQAARASYALATTTDMERVGNGAWLRRRHTVKGKSIQ